MNIHALNHQTPKVTVFDNRGLNVRELQYHRHPDAQGMTDERITRHRHDARGRLVQSADPRLHAAGVANAIYLTDLRGTILRTQSADAGITVALNDAAGRSYRVETHISSGNNGKDDRSQAVTRTWQYEDAALPGRPLGVTEQVAGEVARVTKRFVYAGITSAEKAHNLAGKCVSHHDTAGLVQTDSIALTGVPLTVTRCLLKNVDNPDTRADWQGTDAPAWNAVLERAAYITLTTADATGAVLTITDARGNRQRVAYDVAGLLSGSWLTVKGGTEQVIVQFLNYSAAGQKLHEVQGNGVVTTYTYEPQTQRLIGIKTERPIEHASGRKVMQDLHYEYDPTGNVLRVRNGAEETRYWRNQKVVPENRYVYDSLYQLVSTTGREMANIASQGGNLPLVPMLLDNAAYTNYTRSYTYDNAGNLTQIRHSTPATNNNYTTSMTVSHGSNRAVLSTLTEETAKVDTLFTAGGHQIQLHPGQPLLWTPNGELLKVTSAATGSESYRYDSDSQRLLKVSANSMLTQRTLYLTGVELKTIAKGSAETENLQVIVMGETGRAQVRVLHWEKGKPANINNNQVRYSYDNLIGSCGLELDGDGNIISQEEYYPYGGTAVWTVRSALEANYKTVRYSGNERDTTGLYYYGYRYYQPWAGRWLSADPAGAVDGLNLFRMVRNNPVTLMDADGRVPELPQYFDSEDPIMIGEAPLVSTDSRRVNDIKAEISVGSYKMDDVRSLFTSPGGLSGSLKNTENYPSNVKNSGWQRAEAIVKNELRVVSQMKKFELTPNQILYRGMDMNNEQYERIMSTGYVQNYALSFFSNNLDVFSYFTGRNKSPDVKSVMFRLNMSADDNENVQLREGRLDMNSYRSIFEGKVPEGIKEIIALPGNVFKVESVQPSSSSISHGKKGFKASVSRLFKKKVINNLTIINLKPAEYQTSPLIVLIQVIFRHLQERPERH